MSKSRLQDLLALSTVPRWSVVPHTRPQSVAEHSFRVAVIAYELAIRLNLHGIDQYIAVLWSIEHDGPEAETGDLPYTFKRELPAHVMDTMEQVICPWYRPNIPPPAKVIVKLADKIEEVLFLSVWGTGPKANAALRMAKGLIQERIEEARARFGWSDLSQIVDEIIRSSTRFSFAEQPPSPGQPSPQPPVPSADPPPEYLPPRPLP